MKIFLLQSNALSASVLVVCLVCAIPSVVPQTTHPADADALNTVFASWGISAGDNGWNVSGEICSGKATDPSVRIYDGPNPFIKCNCSFDNSSTCRITNLRVRELDVPGILPEALWSLTYLIDLNLAQNNFAGHISPSVGNLTRMKYLTVERNMLSGPLPKELGLLTNLELFFFGNNNFSGSLPSEIGNLVKLREVDLRSSGVSGEIPQTFSKLQSLTSFDASDNALNGSMPEFIGNWTELTLLKFQGNNFHGSIPTAFSNLTKMQNMRITDIANGISSLAFIRSMTSLRILCLRNNNITGTIPSNIADYTSLQLLDLSFNNLHSDIPPSLFLEASSLKNLYLGNNRLTGSLPSGQSTTLLYIDLSYNYLSGTLPQWIWANKRPLRLNLVFNNFMTEGPDIRYFPAGQECLQRNFPCDHGAGKYSDFAINCGGPQIGSSNNVVFESDEVPVRRVRYQMADSGRWAMSNVGYFQDGEDNDGSGSFTVTSSSQFTNTQDPELFETARLSAGSLRYYGLSLKNGNYSVSLLFAESVMVETANSWKSLAKRRFDVFIQGNQVLKDFDIREEAGGTPNRAVKKDFTALVTENYMEIHLFWAGKGTCCNPDYSTFGPLISAISVTPNFDVSSLKWHNTGMIVGIVVAFVVVLIISGLGYFCFKTRNSGDNVDDEIELLNTNTRPYTFTYSDLRTATGDFSDANKLGEGGFGPVYKGILSDGTVIAVKQLSVGSHQGKTQFYTEIATISSVQHRNLVKLIGCCMDGIRRMLVYEYLVNKSLDQAMFGAECLVLNWEKRFNICMGIARGLAYLHEESSVRIVHRDVKASNILLDAELNPKISDFGMAKLYADKITHISTGVAGTIGYLAPEYAMRGHLTEKADVFSFGVLALEIISGRPNTDTDLEEGKVYLMEWAWELHECGRDLELVDPRLSEFDTEAVKRIIKIALLCTQTSPAMRPAMFMVVAMLSGHIDVNPILSKPMYLTDWRFSDTSNQPTDVSLNTDDGQSGSYGTPVGSISVDQPVPKGRNTY